MSELLLERIARRLHGLQHAAEGPHHFRGEFPMSLRGPVTGEDHNHLSAYALLHLAVAVRTGSLPAPVRDLVDEMLDRARDVPAGYQSAALTSNWYSGKGTGVRAPAGYPWPDGVVLALHDDYDDTAVAALLTILGGLRASAPYRSELFAAARYMPERDRLVSKSQRRMALTGCERDVYQSWVLSNAETLRPDVVLLPAENSVELTTVANIVTAAHLLGAPASDAAQTASGEFVNRLARLSATKLLEGDASYIDFASSYYPRVPFAPLAYLLRDHVVANGTLLARETLALIARAVLEVDENAAWRARGFANPLFWLLSAAWCCLADPATGAQLGGKIARVRRHIEDAAADAEAIPDIVFFHGAHLGDYGGVPYVLAVLVEAFSLLRETA